MQMCFLSETFQNRGLDMEPWGILLTKNYPNKPGNQADVGEVGLGTDNSSGSTLGHHSCNSFDRN